jgi:hypothetical protein
MLSSPSHIRPSSCFFISFSTTAPRTLPVGYQGQGARGTNLTTHLLLFPRLKTYGALPPNPIRLHGVVLRHREYLTSFYLTIPKSGKHLFPNMSHRLVPRSKNGWSCNSTPPIRLHGVVLSEREHRDNFFTFI